MAKFGKTTFTEYIEGPDEQYTLDASRVVRYLDIPNATVQARQQAVADFLGTNVVKTATILRAGSFVNQFATYISRQLPMPYTFAATQPSSLPSAVYLYASNITHGRPLTPSGQTLVAGGGEQLVGGNFARYRFTVEFTTRTYDVRPDTAVLAVASQQVPGAGGGGLVSALNNPTPSPIVGFADEGQAIAGKAWTQFPNWPPVNLPKFSSGTRYVTRYFRPGMRMRVLPYGTVHWNSDNMTIREGAAFNEATADVRYVWHLVPEAGVPFGAIQACINQTNGWWFDGFPIGTLLLAGADLRRSIGPLGDVLYNLEYCFSYLPKPARGVFKFEGNPQNFPVGFPMGWNAQLRAKKMPNPLAPNGTSVNLDYDQIVDDANNNPFQLMFPPADFSTLFRPDQS